VCQVLPPVKMDGIASFDRARLFPAAKDASK
jgi:hypothetical protein